MRHLFLKIKDIVDIIEKKFEDTPPDLQTQIQEFLDEAFQNGYIRTGLYSFFKVDNCPWVKQFEKAPLLFKNAIHENTKKKKIRGVKSLLH